MSRLSDAFPRGRTGLVCYAMGGDPTLAATEELLRAIDGEGADVIEIGLPFSDPIADGPTLQAAAIPRWRASWKQSNGFGCAPRWS